MYTYMYVFMRICTFQEGCELRERNPMDLLALFFISLWASVFVAFRRCEFVILFYFSIYSTYLLTHFASVFHPNCSFVNCGAKSVEAAWSILSNAYMSNLNRFLWRNSNSIERKTLETCPLIRGILSLSFSLQKIVVAWVQRERKREKRAFTIEL